MRLHELSISNFRKLRNCNIKFRDTTFLIGPNNAGKSSVFAALGYLHKNVNLDREDYSKTYDEATDSYVYSQDVTVIAEYQNVPEEAKEWVGFKGRVIPSAGAIDGETGYSIFYKKIWSLQQSKPRVFMQEYKRVPKDIFKGCNTPAELVGGVFTEEFLISHFGEKNMNKGLTLKEISLKLADLPEYWDVVTNEEPEWVENPGGIPGNVLSKLPEVVVIPAESCMSELMGPNGALQKLLNDLFDRVRSDSENYRQAQEFLNLLASELNPNDTGTHFGRLIEDLNGMVGNLFPDSAVHVNASLDVPEKSIKPQFTVEMESNVRTPVNYQGHGMIRATVFQLLRFVQDFINRTKGLQKSTIFCFEEPEIYLHPSAANQMRDSLYSLAGANCQIVATTHSPYMINLGTEKNLSLTKFFYENTEFTSTCSFNLEQAFLNLVGDEKHRLKMLLKLDDYMSRIFFSRKSIFVEGDTEEVVVRETIKRLSEADRARVIGNCEFIRGRGKAVFVSVAKYLNALDINYAIMHDRDHGTVGAEAVNDSILEQTGEERRILIQDCIENVLNYPVPTREKPYMAFRHISNNWGDDFNTLPENWRVIFIKACSPFLDHLA